MMKYLVECCGLFLAIGLQLVTWGMGKLSANFEDASSLHQYRRVGKLDLMADCMLCVIDEKAVTHAADAGLMVTLGDGVGDFRSSSANSTRLISQEVSHPTWRHGGSQAQTPTQTGKAFRCSNQIRMTGNVSPCRVREIHLRRRPSINDGLNLWGLHCTWLISFDTHGGQECMCLGVSVPSLYGFDLGGDGWPVGVTEF